MTTDVAPRFRGFLASCMLEIAPGVYTAPRMSRGVRDRVLTVLRDWWGQIPGGSIVVTWPDRTLQGGQAVECFGLPQKTLYNYHGLHLVYSPASAEDTDLKT